MKLVTWMLPAAACAACACAAPLMTPAATRLPPPPSPESARIVFVQGPYDGYSTTDHASIVDENARLLGESWPNTWFSVDLAPGDHELFGWQSDWPGTIPFAHLCTCVVTHCQQIAVMRARLEAGRTYYVFLRGVGSGGHGPLPLHLDGRRYPGTGWSARFDFVASSPLLDRWPEALTERLRGIEAVPARATERTAEAGGGYRKVILCMGEKRMSDPQAWDPKTSALRPEDGAPAGAPISP